MQIGALQAKIATYKEQIGQSEINLCAQHDALSVKKKIDGELAVRAHQADAVQSVVDASALDRDKVEHILGRIAQTASRDRITV